MSLFLVLFALSFVSASGIFKQTKKSYDSLFAAVKSSVKKLPKEDKALILNKLKEIDSRIESESDAALTKVYSTGIDELNSLLKLSAGRGNAE